MSQYQREERQDNEQRKGQIRKDKIKRWIAMLIVVESRKQQQILLRNNGRHSKEASHCECRRKSFEDEGPNDCYDEMQQCWPVGCYL